MNPEVPGPGTAAPGTAAPGMAPAEPAPPAPPGPEPSVPAARIDPGARRRRRLGRLAVGRRIGARDTPRRTAGPARRPTRRARHRRRDVGHPARAHRPRPPRLRTHPEFRLGPRLAGGPRRLRHPAGRGLVPSHAGRHVDEGADGRSAGGRRLSAGGRRLPAVTVRHLPGLSTLPAGPPSVTPFRIPLVMQLQTLRIDKYLEIARASEALPGRSACVLPR